MMDIQASDENQTRFEGGFRADIIAAPAHSSLKDAVTTRRLNFLRGLPALGAQEATDTVFPPCKMCGSKTVEFTAVDFYKSCEKEKEFGRSGILVDYIRCENCEYIFTTFCDDWSSQDFVDLIYNDDYVKVDKEFTGERGRRTAHSMAPVLDGGQNKRILDYGSGAGFFTDELARLGFNDVVSFDPYTNPRRPEGRFDVVTADEVLEHSATPLAALADMLNFMEDDGCLLIGQTLQPVDIETVRGGWWYLAPRNGHLSFFSDETMRQYATRHGLIFENFGARFSLSRPGRSSYTRTVIERSDPLNERVELFSPSRQDGEPFGWHPFEDEGAFDYRWTATSEVFLGEYDLEGRRELVVPYHISIQDQFLTESYLKVGDRLLPLKRRGSTLTAWFETDRKVRYPVTLMTPEPVTPAAEGDVRRLGLAILSSDRRPARPIGAIGQG